MAARARRAEERSFACCLGVSSAGILPEAPFSFLFSFLTRLAFYQTPKLTALNKPIGLFFLLELVLTLTYFDANCLG